jgi:hypothetical protein
MADARSVINACAPRLPGTVRDYLVRMPRLPALAQRERVAEVLAVVGAESPPRRHRLGR